VFAGPGAVDFGVSDSIFGQASSVKLGHRAVPGSVQVSVPGL
jgi:hypothetical protein